MKGGFSLKKKKLWLWNFDLQNIEICERALLRSLYRVQYTDKSCVSQPEPLLHQWSVVHSSVFTLRFAASTMPFLGFQDSWMQKHKAWLGKSPMSGFIYFIFIFFVINNFLLIFSHITQHSIQNITKQNKTHAQHIKVQSKGRERGKDNKNTKVTPLYNHVYQ